MLILHLQHASLYICPQDSGILNIYCVSFLLEARKVARSFSFVNRIHNRLRNSISTDLLKAFAVIARHVNAIRVLSSNVENKYISIQPHRVIAFFTFLLTLYLLDICTFC